MRSLLLQRDYSALSSVSTMTYTGIKSIKETEYNKCFSKSYKDSKSESMKESNSTVKKYFRP